MLGRDRTAIGEVIYRKELFLATRYRILIISFVIIIPVILALSQPSRFSFDALVKAGGFIYLILFISIFPLILTIIPGTVRITDNGIIGPVYSSRFIDFRTIRSAIVKDDGIKLRTIDGEVRIGFYRVLEKDDIEGIRRAIQNGMNRTRGARIEYTVGASRLVQYTGFHFDHIRSDLIRFAIRKGTNKLDEELINSWAHSGNNVPQGFKEAIQGIIEGPENYLWYRYNYGPRSRIKAALKWSALVCLIALVILAVIGSFYGICFFIIFIYSTCFFIIIPYRESVSVSKDGIMLMDRRSTFIPFSEMKDWNVKRTRNVTSTVYINLINGGRLAFVPRKYVNYPNVWVASDLDWFRESVSKGLKAYRSENQASDLKRGKARARAQNEASPKKEGDPLSRFKEWEEVYHELRPRPMNKDVTWLIQSAGYDPVFISKRMRKYIVDEGIERIDMSSFEGWLLHWDPDTERLRHRIRKDIGNLIKNK